MISCRLSSSSTGQALSHVSKGLFCRREVGTKTGRADVLVDVSRVLGGSSNPLRPTGTATHGETLRFPTGFAASHFSFATPAAPGWLQNWLHPKLPFHRGHRSPANRVSGPLAGCCQSIGKPHARENVPPTPSAESPADSATASASVSSIHVEILSPHRDAMTAVDPSIATT